MAFPLYCSCPVTYSMSFPNRMAGTRTTTTSATVRQGALITSFSPNRQFVCRAVFGGLLALLVAISGLANLPQLQDHHHHHHPGYPGEVPIPIPGFAKRVKHPVVMVPGIVSSALEVWESDECAGDSLRSRMWGSTSMLQNMLLARSCWLRHMLLDYVTGTDPPGIKLRAASGLEAADYFVGGYWVWAKLIQQLAWAGYDSNSQFMAPYDWRLSLGELQGRDAFFSKLRALIEVARDAHGEKVVVVAHSWGCNMFLYFMQWAEAENSGWTERYLQSFVGIGGPLLGLPKSVTSLLSGEMRDTAELSPVLDYVRRSFLSQRDVAGLFRSWGSIAHMLPKGGEPIWGDHNSAPDDDHDSTTTASHGQMIQFVDCSAGQIEQECPELDHSQDYTLEHPLPLHKIRDLCTRNYTAQSGLDLLRSTSPVFMRRIDSQYSFGAHLDKDFTSGNTSSKSKAWSNPLQSPLPNAPSLTIYSFYGVGLLTERAYHYRVADPPLTCSEFPFALDSSLNDLSGNLSSGVFLADGDGTVPLISMGFMGRRGWRDPQLGLNPSGVKIVTREYLHEHPVGLVEHGRSVLRLRSDSADHVNIMGNHRLIRDVLQIVMGIPNDTDVLHSDIDLFSERVRF